MNIIVVSDIHGDVENLLAYIDKIKEMKFDAVVCPGDFTDVNTPKGFTQEDILKLIVSELKSFKTPVIAVPGNVDPKSTIKILEDGGMSVHGRGMIIEGVGFFGYGGAKTPFDTTIEPTDEELGQGLQKSYNDVEKTKYKVQVTHAPPHGTRIDMIQSGVHVGSQIVRSSIEKRKPLLAISSHIHEARGIDKINNTTLVNSGRFPEGYCGVINIDNGVVKAEILNIIE